MRQPPVPSKPFSVRGALAGDFGSAAGVREAERRAAVRAAKSVDELDVIEADERFLRGQWENTVVVSVHPSSADYGASKTNEVLVPLNGTLTWSLAVITTLLLFAVCVFVCLFAFFCLNVCCTRVEPSPMSW